LTFVCGSNLLCFCVLNMAFNLGGNTSTNADNPNNDILVGGGPSDSVSSLHWSPAQGSNFLAATSWSKDAFLWEVNSQGQSNLKVKQQLQAPLLCSAWTGDNSKVFLGGCDNKAFMWSLGQNNIQQVAQHDAPIKEVAFLDSMNLLLTASWDKTIRYWDMRQPAAKAAITVTLDERVYCMDLKAPVLVVGTAAKGKNLVVFDLSNPSNLNRPYSILESPLKFQSRCVSIFPDRKGFAVGKFN
jgi:mRNA export factor